MTGERAPGGCAVAGSCMAERVVAFGPVTSGSVCGRRLDRAWNDPGGRRTDVRRRAFPRNVRMFVDYLVTGIPGVEYGDLYKGRVEVVSGVATSCRM